MEKYINLEYKSIWVSSTQPVKLVATNQLSDGSGEDKFAVIPVRTSLFCYTLHFKGLPTRQLLHERCRWILPCYWLLPVNQHRYYHCNPRQYNRKWFSLFLVGQLLQVSYYGVLLPVSLNKGQQYTIVTTRPHSAIPIQSTKPVAVITGAVCGYGYYNVPQIHCSHEVRRLLLISNSLRV